jgi:hypothetical protein
MIPYGRCRKARRTRPTRNPPFGTFFEYNQAVGLTALLKQSPAIAIKARSPNGFPNHTRVSDPQVQGYTAVAAKAFMGVTPFRKLFAHLKRILRLDRLRLRGPNGARDEFLLAATAQYLRKLGKLMPPPAPTPAA